MIIVEVLSILDDHCRIVIHSGFFVPTFERELGVDEKEENLDIQEWIGKSCSNHGTI